MSVPYMINDPEVSKQFEEFMRIYDKRIKEFYCRHLWATLTAETRKLIMEHVPRYVLSTPDKKFRRDPASYLSENGWLDEIIENPKDPKATPTTYVKPENKKETSEERYERLKREGALKLSLDEEYYAKIKEARPAQTQTLGLGDRMRQQFERKFGKKTDNP